MNKVAYELDFIHPDYEKEFNRFIKKKKFKKLPNQIVKLMDDFEEGVLGGKVIAHSEDPAYDVYKVRLANEDTQAGKSNGYRVIYLARHIEKTVAFLYIYYKKEQETIADEHVKALVDGYFLHLMKENDDTEEFPPDN